MMVAFWIKILEAVYLETFDSVFGHRRPQFGGTIPWNQQSQSYSHTGILFPKLWLGQELLFREQTQKSKKTPE